MRRPLFIVTNILLPALAVVAMIFVFWHWKGYPLPAQLTSGKVGAMVAKLKRLKAEKVYIVRQKLHRRDCLGELRFFKLADNVFTCENAEKGTWFIHFQEDNTIRLGLPPGTTTSYQPRGNPAIVVDLSEVFADPATFQRTTSNVISIESTHGPRHFRLQPDYSIPDPALACHKLTLEEIGGDPIATFRIELADKAIDWEKMTTPSSPKEEADTQSAPTPTAGPASPAPAEQRPEASEKNEGKPVMTLPSQPAGSALFPPRASRSEQSTPAPSLISIPTPIPVPTLVPDSTSPRYPPLTPTATPDALSNESPGQ
jgi:hypothetical protein